jgi:alpha-beta hydrolase superfamily lysophospholipase
VRVLPGRKHDLLHDRGADEVMQAIRAWLNERVPRG